MIQFHFKNEGNKATGTISGPPELVERIFDACVNAIEKEVKRINANCEKWVTVRKRTGGCGFIEGEDP